MFGGLIYRIYPKYKDRPALANSIDPVQMQRNVSIWRTTTLFFALVHQVSDTPRIGKMDLFNYETSMVMTYGVWLFRVNTLLIIVVPCLSTHTRARARKRKIVSEEARSSATCENKFLRQDCKNSILLGTSRFAQTHENMPIPIYWKFYNPKKR